MKRQGNSPIVTFVPLEHFVSCIEFSEMIEEQARGHFMEDDSKKIRGF